MEWKPDRQVIDEIVSELENIPQDCHMRVIGNDGVREYSPQQLISEVSNGTEIGKEIYNAHLELKGMLEDLPQ